ncbi:MAG: VacJ family lipoprotein [Mariprofundales bacterium]|nr:VacJ family lipoprotein [Mariprofundales bacterium]
MSLRDREYRAVWWRSLLAVLWIFTASGCATVENHHDPLESINRVSDGFNTLLDKITLAPTARGYGQVTPGVIRTIVSNFFDNSVYMNVVLNDLLQGKGRQGAQDFGRFLFNSTLGVGGLFDPATSIGLVKHDEDFGQTLATWGVGEGAYVVYPFFGPNSYRNTPDFVTATVTDVLFWVSLSAAPAVTIPLTVLKAVDKRYRLIAAANLRDDMALDTYIFTREAWRQHREFLIYDGSPPSHPSRDDWEDDDWVDDGA